MPLPGWGTAIGVLAKIFDRATDPKQKINREIDAIEKEWREIVKQPATDANCSRADALVAKLSELREKRAKLPD